MQTQRLFEIIYILMERKRVTAAELAARFEVSSRTVYRDIDTLSAAGIPIYASKGRGGGISLPENFVLNKSVLSGAEQWEILSSLQSLAAVTPGQSNEVLNRLSSLFKREVEDWIEVDFTNWSGNNSFSLLKAAILEKRAVSFDYANTNGEQSRREVEPLQLRFKHRAWYLYAFCRAKQDYRLFKLSRIRNLRLTDSGFNRPPALPPLWQAGPLAKTPPLLTFKMRIEASQAYRVYDEFDDWQVERLSCGRFMVTVCCIEDEWVYGLILSFGAYAEVIEPEHLRQNIRERLCAAQKKYL